MPLAQVELKKLIDNKFQLLNDNIVLLTVKFLLNLSSQYICTFRIILLITAPPVLSYLNIG